MTQIIQQHRMHQKYGLLAFSLLVFSTILVVAISIDPKGFTLRDWQPLIAAIIAFGGAAFVYRGATLTFQAAMAKVALDERIHETAALRQRRGLYLRLRHGVFLLQQDAERRVQRLKAAPTEGTKSIKLSSLKLVSGREELAEAWAALDAFPRAVAIDVANLRILIRNIDSIMEGMNSAPITLTAGEEAPERARSLVQQYEHITPICSRLRAFTTAEMED